MAAMDIEQGTFPPRSALEMDTGARHADQGTLPRRLAPEVDTAAPGLPRGCRICLYVLFGSVGLFIASLLLWFIVEAIMYKEPNYSVAIAAVSGLEPDTDIARRPALDPEFNLTVVVARRSPLVHRCGYPGTTVRVSYHGFELASAVAPDFCEAEGTRTIIARGERVWLPAPALGSLAADMRRAAGVFDVTIKIPNTGDTTGGVVHGLLISCMGRRVGEDVGGGVLCDVSA